MSGRWTELISHLEILFLRTAVSRLARLGSWQTNRTPTRVSAYLHPLTGETFHLRERGGRGYSYIRSGTQLYLLLLTEDDGGDVPELRHLLLQRVTFLICWRIRILTGPRVGQHFSLVYKPVATLLKLHWATSLCQAASPALGIFITSQLVIL